MKTEILIPAASLEEVAARLNFEGDMRALPFPTNANCRVALRNFLVLEDARAAALLTTGAPAVAYNKYYWLKLYQHRLAKLGHHDPGLDQQVFATLEEIQNSVDNVDWGLVEQLDKLVNSDV